MKNILKYGSASAIVVLVAAVFSFSSLLSHAATGTGTVYFAPTSTTTTIGNNITFAVHENSGSTPVISTQIVLKYGSGLQYVSADSSSPFTGETPDTLGNGSVQIDRGSFGVSQTGDQLVTNITFKTLATGPATITFDQTNTYAANNGTGVPVGETFPNNGTYSVTVNSNVAPTCPTGDTGTYPNCVAPTCPTGDTGVYPNCVAPIVHSCPTGYTGVYPACVAPTGGNAPTGTSKGTSVTVTPQSGASGGGVTVSNNGTAAVNTPVTVQPATIQTEGVKSVQYYLNGKLVDTETTAPYKYSVNTKALTSGTYKLETKTNYTNGTSKSSIQNLVVKNASVKKSGSILGTLIVIIILVAVAVLLFITLKRRKPRHHQSLPPIDPDVFASEHQTIVPSTEAVTPPAKTTLPSETKVAPVAKPVPVRTPPTTPAPQAVSVPSPSHQVSDVDALAPGSIFAPQPPADQAKEKEISP